MLVLPTLVYGKVLSRRSIGRHHWPWQCTEPWVGTRAPTGHLQAPHFVAAHDSDGKSMRCDNRRVGCGSLGATENRLGPRPENDERLPQARGKRSLRYGGQGINFCLRAIAHTRDWPAYANLQAIKTNTRSQQIPKVMNIPTHS